MARKTIWEAIKDEGREEGKKEGKKEGRKEGEVEGRREALLLQMRKRFGPLPLEMKSIIDNTGSARHLDQWLERIVTVNSLEEMHIAPL